MIITEPVDKNMSKIPIVEVFESIQGEGPYMGRYSLFIRFAGCNLAGVCKSCDTDFRTRMMVSKDYIIRKIVDFAKRGGRVVVFTGGEPSLYRNIIDDIVREIKFMYPFDIKFQVETNGIIKMGVDFISLGGVVVVSPKKGFEHYAIDNYAGKSYAHFKVVVGADKNDYTFWDFEGGERFINDLIELGHNKTNIWLMPFGADEEILSRNRQEIWRMCIKYGVNYSDRIHVIIFGKSMEGI